MEKETKENEQRRREAERESQIREEAKHKEKTAKPPPNISAMEAVTRDAYGGGMYGTEEGQPAPKSPPASETQSADAPVEFSRLNPKHTPPPSTGDRDVDITGQSYIQ